jgi:tetratricopeptide (TPR) repeat protein
VKDDSHDGKFGLVNCLGLGDSVFVGWRAKAKAAKASFGARVSVLWLGLGLAITVLPGGLIAVNSEDPFQLGLSAYQRGQLNEALKYFREAAQLHPGEARIANALGNTWFALNEPAKAAEEYRRALRLDPRLAAAQKNLGILEYQQGKFIEAQQTLAAATVLSPADPAAWRFLGLAWAASGHPTEAVAPLKRSLELRPRDSAVRLALARAEEDAGERAAARADYRLLVQDPSLDVHGQALVGMALLALDDAEAAAVQLAFALQHSPADEELALALARAQLVAQQPEQAQRTLQSALTAAKDKAPLYELAGWIEQQNHHPTQAAEAYRNAVLADPKRHEPYLQLSWLYAEHRHFEEAETTLREGLRFVEATYPLKVQLGTVLVLAGREKEAVPILEEAVASQPRNPLGYSTLIIADTMVDTSYAKPLRSAETAIRECPGDYLVRYLYAGLLLREHRADLGQPGTEEIFQRIRSELVESIRLNPNFPHSHYDLARLDYDTQDFAQAEREATAALDADKDFSSALYLLGRIHLKEGRREEGMDEIAQVDREHREELQRIQAVGQTLLAAQAAGMGTPTPMSHSGVAAVIEPTK